MYRAGIGGGNANEGDEGGLREGKNQAGWTSHMGEGS